MKSHDDLAEPGSGNGPGPHDALFAESYPELRKLAHSRLHQVGADPLLNTTALIHEAFLRFQHCGKLQADHRRAFFAYASQVMRSVIIDTVRERQAQRRGGDLAIVTLDTQHADSLPAQGEQILQVHEALAELAAAEPRLAQVVQMRYFGGYSDPEIADTLGLTVRTVQRDWEKARLLLFAALKC